MLRTVIFFFFHKNFTEKKGSYRCCTINWKFGANQNSFQNLRRKIWKINYIVTSEKSEACYIIIYKILLKMRAGSRSPWLVKSEIVPEPASCHRVKALNLSTLARQRNLLPSSKTSFLVTLLDREKHALKTRVAWDCYKKRGRTWEIDCIGIDKKKRDWDFSLEPLKEGGPVRGRYIGWSEQSDDWLCSHTFAICTALHCPREMLKTN